MVESRDFLGHDFFMYRYREECPKKRRAQKLLLIIGDRSGFPSNFVSARVRLSLDDAADRFGPDPGSANPC